MTLYDQVRAALDGLDLPAADLDRAAAAAVAELNMASTAPVLAAMSGAPWITIKARASASSETVGSLKEGARFMVGRPEGSWRPVYGQPLGWIAANLAREIT